MRTYIVTIIIRKNLNRTSFGGLRFDNKKEQGLSSSGDVNPHQEYNKTLALQVYCITKWQFCQGFLLTIIAFKNQTEDFTMKKLKMAKGIMLTFEEGCNKYLENCRQRNLRQGTINNYKQSYKFYKFFKPDILNA